MFFRAKITELQRFRMFIFRWKDGWFFDSYTHTRAGMIA
jgi:hypothetical protein